MKVKYNIYGSEENKKSRKPKKIRGKNNQKY